MFQAISLLIPFLPMASICLAVPVNAALNSSFVNVNPAAVIPYAAPEYEKSGNVDHLPLVSAKNVPKTLSML